MQLPRLYLSWHTPALFAPGDAELDIAASVLTGGKNSRLYKRLVYDLQLAQNVSASQASAKFGSRFTIIVTARPSSDPPEKVLEKIKGIVDEELEKLRAAAPEAREVDRARNGYESSFLSQMEVVAAKAEQLNAYYFATGNPDYFAKDLARYQAVQPPASTSRGEAMAAGGQAPRVVGRAGACRKGASVMTMHGSGVPGFRGSGVRGRSRGSLRFSRRRSPSRSARHRPGRRIRIDRRRPCRDRRRR